MWAHVAVAPVAGALVGAIAIGEVRPEVERGGAGGREVGVAVQRVQTQRPVVGGQDAVATHQPAGPAGFGVGLEGHEVMPWAVGPEHRRCQRCGRGGGVEQADEFVQLLLQGESGIVNGRDVSRRGDGVHPCRESPGGVGGIAQHRLRGRQRGQVYLAARRTQYVGRQRAADVCQGQQHLAGQVIDDNRQLLYGGGRSAEQRDGADHIPGQALGG